jgi:hypothetical protein
VGISPQSFSLKKERDEVIRVGDQHLLHAALQFAKEIDSQIASQNFLAIIADGDGTDQSTTS